MEHSMKTIGSNNQEIRSYKIMKKKVFRFLTINDTYEKTANIICIRAQKYS